MNGRFRSTIVSAIVALTVVAFVGTTAPANAETTPTVHAAAVVIKAKVTYTDTATKDDDKTVVKITNTSTGTITYPVRDIRSGKTHTVKKVTLKPGQTAKVTVPGRNAHPMWVMGTRKGKTAQVAPARVSKYDSMADDDYFFVAVGCEQVTGVNLLGQDAGFSWNIDTPTTWSTGSTQLRNGKIKQKAVPANGVFEYAINTYSPRETWDEGTRRPLDC